MSPDVVMMAGHGRNSARVGCKNGSDDDEIARRQGLMRARKKPS